MPLHCVFYRTKSNGEGAFISQWKRWRGVFAPAKANEKKTIHSFCGIRVCVEYYASELWVNYRRTMGELYGTNWIGEPHLCKEYKGLLGANYANRARLVSVGKLSRRTMCRAELSTKTKHNIKSFSKNQGATVPLRLRALTNKVTK